MIPSRIVLVSDAVWVQPKSGERRVYPTVNTDASRGTALLAAIDAAAAGDTIHLSAGTFNIGETTRQLPASVNLIGSGMRATIILSTNNVGNAGTTKACIALSDNCVVADLKVDSQPVAGSLAVLNGLAAPLGVGTNDTNTFTNAVLRNVWVTGDSDALYITRSSGACSLKCYGCIFEGKVDSVRIDQVAHEVEMFGCTIYTHGASSNSNWTFHRGVSVQGATVKFYGCHFQIDEQAVYTPTQAAAIHLDGTSGTIEVYGGRAVSYSTANDIEIEHASHTLKLAGLAYDTSKVSNSGGGTISYLDAGPIRKALASGQLLAEAFAPEGNPPASNFPTLDTRNGRYVFVFDKDTDKSMIWLRYLKGAYGGGGVNVKIFWTTTDTNTAHLVRWQVAIERGNTDVDSDSFATAQSAGGTAPGTSGVFKTTTVALTNSQIDGLVAGEPFFIKINRDADGTSGTDDVDQSAELWGWAMEEA